MGRFANATTFRGSYEPSWAVRVMPSFFIRLRACSPRIVVAPRGPSITLGRLFYDGKEVVAFHSCQVELSLAGGDR